MNRFEKHFGSPEKLVKHFLKISSLCPMRLVNPAHQNCKKDCLHYEKCPSASISDNVRWAIEWLQEECDE